MNCGPLDGGGFTIDGVAGVAAGGFTEMFYMQKYCWENMVDYPVTDQNITVESGGKSGLQAIQVFDENYPDKVMDLSFIKIFPYVLMAYSIAMFIPYLIWSSMCASKVKSQLDFLMSGFEEGLTMTIGGLAKMLDNKKWLENVKRETAIYNALETELNKVNRW